MESHPETCLANDASSRKAPAFSTDVKLVVLLAVLATVPRLAKLSNSLWLDEGYSLAAARSLQDYDAARPLYFWGLSLWMSIGQSEVWLRLPSLLFGVGCVALCYLLARRLSNRTTAIISALLIGFATPQLFHSQEVRLYTLAPLLLLGATHLLLSWLERPSVYYLLGHGLASYLALLACPPALVGLALMWLLCALKLRNDWSRLAMLTGLSLVIGLAWLPFALRLLANPEGISWITRPTPGQVLDLQGWAFGAKGLSELPLNWRIARWAMRLSSLLILGLALVGGLTVRGRAIAAWYFAIVAIAFIASITVQPVWTPRYFMPFFPALFFLVAHGLDVIRTRSRSAFLVFVSVLAVFELTSSTADALYGPVEDWRHVATKVSSAATKNDIVVVSALPIDPSNTGVWQYYYRGAAPVVYWRSERNSSDEWRSKLAEIARGLAPTGHLWLALRTSPIADERRSEIRARLAESFTLKSEDFNGVELLSLEPR